MDNGQTVAPLIPAGTQPTVWGTKSFIGTPTQAATQGQATQSAQVGQSGAEQTAQTNPNAPTGTTFADLAAKKGFKSADDLAFAYANLESQNKKVEMSLAELAKLREDALKTPAPTPEQLAQVNSQDQAVNIVNNLIKSQVRPLEDKLALQELFAKNPDAQEHAVEMARLVKETPGMPWNVAYKAAKSDKLQAELVAQRNLETQKVEELKQRVSVGSTKSTATAPSRSIDDLISDKSIPFSEVQRLMTERFRQ